MFALLSMALQGLCLLPWMRYIESAFNNQESLASGGNSECLEEDGWP